MPHTSDDLIDHFLENNIELLHKIFTLMPRHQWVDWKRLTKCALKFSDMNWIDRLSDQHLNRMDCLVQILISMQIDFQKTLIYGDGFGLLSSALFRSGKIKVSAIRQLTDPVCLRAADEINFEEMKDEWTFKSCLRPADPVDLAVSNFETIRYRDQLKMQCEFTADTILIDGAENIRDLKRVLATGPAGRLYVLSYATNPGLSTLLPDMRRFADLKSATNLKEIYFERTVSLPYTDVWVLIGRK